MKLLKTFAIVCVLALSLLLVGCGGGPGPVVEP